MMSQGDYSLTSTMDRMRTIESQLQDLQSLNDPMASGVRMPAKPVLEAGIQSSAPTTAATTAATAAATVKQPPPTPEQSKQVSEAFKRVMSIARGNFASGPPMASPMSNHLPVLKELKPLGALVQKAAPLLQKAGVSIPAPIQNIIDQNAQLQGVDANLVAAIVKAESGFNPKAVSSVGAQGLMQLMPATAKSLGVTNPFDPSQNVAGGVKYLAGLIKRFDGNIQHAVAAYNAGPGAVNKYGGIPPYKETQNYVKKVMAYWSQFNQG
jgi:soluble lytic murein transglycosylase-like protein